MNIDASFVRSAATAGDFPQDRLAAVVLVGRSNVGKSSLINALVRQRIARTSAAPGKTRLANLYRVARPGAAPLYLVDLPGYGYARGDRSEITATMQAALGWMAGRAGRGSGERPLAGVLLVDARHPGLAADREAWDWLQRALPRSAVAATKIDKLARGERIRSLRELESVFERPVLPVSAATGEGLDELWKLIDRLANSSRPPAATPPPRRPPRKR